VKVVINVYRQQTTRKPVGHELFRASPNTPAGRVAIDALLARVSEAQDEKTQRTQRKKTCRQKTRHLDESSRYHITSRTLQRSNRINDGGVFVLASATATGYTQKSCLKQSRDAPQSNVCRQAAKYFIFAAFETCTRCDGEPPTAGFRK
jgi:hypothetical protein